MSVLGLYMLLVLLYMISHNHVFINVFGRNITNILRIYLVIKILSFFGICDV